MDSSVRSLDSVPFQFINDQVYVRILTHRLDSKPHSSEELEQAKSMTGAPFVWHKHEKEAIYLRANGQHLFFPSSCTDTQKKVIEQYRQLSPFIALNGFKLIRLQLMSISADIFNFNDPEVQFLFPHFFRSLDFYLSQGKNSSEFRNYLNGLNNNLIRLIDFVCIQKDNFKSSPNYIKCLELESLLKFLSHCLNNVDQMMPNLLIPCLAFPVVPVDYERITSLYLDAGKCCYNGLKILQSSIEKGISILFGNNDNDKPQSKKAIKKSKQNGSDLNRLKKIVSNFLENSQNMLNELRKNTCELITKEYAELWCNLLVSKGVVKLKDRSVCPAINETQLGILEGNFFKKSSNLSENCKIFEAKYLKELKLLKPTIDKINSIVSANRSCDFTIFNDFFNTFLSINYNVFYETLENALAIGQKMEKKRSKELERVIPYFIVSKNLYPCALIKPIDCIFHETMDSLMQIETLIPQNETESKALNEALKLILIIFDAFDGLIKQLDPDALHWVDDPEVSDQCIQSIKSHSFLVRNHLRSLSLSSDKSSDKLASFINAIETVLSRVDLMKNLCTDFSIEDNRSMLLPVMQCLGKFKESIIPDQEMVNRFEKACCSISGWLLKKFNVAENFTLFNSTVGHVEEFNQMIHDSSFNEIVKDLGDFSFFEYAKFEQSYKDLELYCFRMQFIIQNCSTLLEESKEQWTEKYKHFWILILGMLRDCLKSLPPTETEEAVNQMLLKLNHILKDKELIPSFVEKGEKHRSIVLLLSKVSSGLNKTFELLEHHVCLQKMVLFLVNFSLIEQWSAKQIQFQLEEGRSPTSRRKTTSPGGRLANTQVSSAYLDETESESPATSSKLDLVTRIENLPRIPINPCLIPVIELRGILRGLFVLTQKQSSLPGKEQVYNALHYTAHISELLGNYAEHDHWHDSSILEFLSKSALLLEQTLKYSLKQLNVTWSDDEQTRLKGHDLFALWQLYQTRSRDPSMAIDMIDPEIVEEFSSMISKTSRYPLDSGSSKLIKFLRDSMAMSTKQLMKEDPQLTTHRLNSGEFKKYREAGSFLIEVSFKIWKKHETIPSYTLEYPDVVQKSEKDVKPELQKQWQLVLKASRGIKKKPPIFTSEACSMQFKECFGHIEGALYILGELLSHVDAEKVPYTVADAILLHTSTLLEQSALALIAQLNINHPQMVNQRPWKYSHDISDFLEKIGQSTETFKLNDHQLKHVQEVTEFLTTTTHYPSAGVGALSLALDNLRKLCELRRKYTLNQRFLNPDENSWCKENLGKQPETWMLRIKKQIEIELNHQIYSRAVQTLEIALMILSHVMK